MNDAVLVYLDAVAWPIVAIFAILMLAPPVRAAIHARRTSSRQSDGQRQLAPRAVVNELDGILDGVIALNAQSPHREVEPAVHLATALRLSPLDFGSSALEIGRGLRLGKVTIVDFAQLAPLDARRLADFCSGLACHSAAWIFRASETVLILTPPSRA